LKKSAFLFELNKSTCPARHFPIFQRVRWDGYHVNGGFEISTYPTKKGGLNHPTGHVQPILPSLFFISYWQIFVFFI